MTKQHTILAAGIAALCGLTANADAASVISRLNPPSAKFSFNDDAPPIISRFVAGQRFDLNCTVQPDAGRTVSSVVFKVDGATVTGTVGMIPATVNPPTVVANSICATRYAYSITAPGVHTLTAIATLDDSSTVTATGNFEIVREPGVGALKNVIIMIGDGMGSAHRTAARIMSKGVQQGKANAPLNMDTFPVTGMVQTSSLNSIITDSSPGAACYSTGNKSNNNQQGVFPDDTADAFDNPRVELIGEFLARKKGKAVGIVTTADVFDATPGAFGTHTSNRGAGTGICDEYLDEAHGAYSGIGDGAGLKVLLGGGRKWFLPNTTTGSARNNGSDFVLPAGLVTGWGLPTVGALDAGRDLIADFQTAGFSYAADGTTMTSAAALPGTTKLLGLFTYSNMNVSLDKINGSTKRNVPSPTLGTPVVDAFGFPDQPMLDEMTDAALKVLDRDNNGFVLMVEGASIDKQAHNMDTERWILDTIEFDRAIGVAKAYAASHKNTLVIITADHECAGAAIIGASTQTNTVLASRVAANAGPGTDVNRNGALNGGDTPGLRLDLVGTYDAAGFPVYSTNPDGYPATTDIDKRMLIGYGANADRYENWLTNELPLTDSQQPASGTPYGAIAGSLPTSPFTRDTTGNFLVTGQIPDAVAAHTASDIPLSAYGKGAADFTGYFDNTEVFFKIMRLFGVR